MRRNFRGFGMNSFIRRTDHRLNNARIETSGIRFEVLSKPRTGFRIRVQSLVRAGVRLGRSIEMGCETLPQKPGNRQAVMRGRKKSHSPTQKPVAHCRGRISGEITDVANVTMVDRTGQAKS
jgi:hypothetical protein